jgi:hypothetical protein
MLSRKSLTPREYEYFIKSKHEIMIHPKTSAELEEMLRVLKDDGENAAFCFVRRRLKRE